MISIITSQLHTATTLYGVVVEKECEVEHVIILIL